MRTSVTPVRRNKLRRLIPAALLLLVGEAVGQASYIQLTNATQLSNTDLIATYSQPDSTAVASDHVTITSDDNDFAIGPVSLSAAPASNVPETASLLLWCAGAVILSISQFRFRNRP